MTPSNTLLTIATLISCCQLAHGYQNAIRYTDLVEELALRGLPLPDGSGVAVTQVEARLDTDGSKTIDATDGYAPDVNITEFSGKTFNINSGTGLAPSGHATTVGRNLYGSTTSMAPGINNIDIYEAGDWLNSGWRDGDPPVESNPLQNHSWVAFAQNLSLTELDAPTLRMDYAAETYDFLPIAGLYNTNFGSQDIPSDIPEIYGSMYNGITVGLSNGVHRTGTTSTADGPNRTKPEIVAPAAYTSYATPYVTAAAALLIDAAGSQTAAKDPLTLKALLLAGADKLSVANWGQTTTRPLDEVYGAGELDIYNAYWIQAAGQQIAGTNVNPMGWNLSNLSATSSHDYTVVVPTGFQLRNLSALVTWNRQVARTESGPGRNKTITYTPTLADLSLSLKDASANLIQSSDSPYDNLEHIWRGNGNELSADSYTLTITTDILVDYAFAWRGELYQDYTLWRSTAFQSTAISEQDPEDDPDKDSIPNLLEQAFGGDPEISDASVLPQSQIVTDNNSDYLEISFRRPEFANGLNYTVQTVTQLGDTWTSSEAAVTLIGISTESGGYNRYTYRRVDPIADHEKAFLRVSVTQ